MKQQLHTYRGKAIALKVQIVLICFLGLSINLFGQGAQISISNPTGVNVCDVSETVEIEILNLSDEILSNITIDIDLPTGIEYEPSSLIDLSSYNVQEQNISNLNSIVLSANNLQVDGTINFTVKISATMDAIDYQNSGNVFRNDVTINFTGGSSNSLSNAYNLYYPVLSITNVNPTSKTIVSGISFSRQITIVNAGNGRVSAFSVSDIHGEGIELSSVNIGTLNATKDTIFLEDSDFNTIGNNDNYFDSNESITISQTVVASGCQATTVTSAIRNMWGCSDKIQSTKSYAYVSISLKTPSITVTTTNELAECFGDGSASTQTISLQNKGLGRADNIQLDIFKSKGSGYFEEIFSRIDESDITYQIIDGASGTITPTTTYSTTNSGSYSCLGANPIGRVILDLPNLEAGKRMIITFKTYHCNISVCNNDYVSGWRYDLDYTDVCGDNNYSKVATGQNENKTNMTIFPETPTDINNDETKQFSYTVSSHDNDLPVGTGAEYKVVFDLPAGIAFSDLEYYNIVSWEASSIDYNTSTNQVVAHYALPLPSGFDMTKSEFLLDLTGDCDMAGAVAGSLDIGLNIYYITSSSCGFEIPFICDEVISVDLHCPSGTDCEGISFDNFSFERTSFGSPDNNQDGLPDETGELDFNRVKTNRVMQGDTIQGSFSGVVYCSPTNPNWSYAYASQNIEWGTYLSAITASIIVYDASEDEYINSVYVPFSGSVNGLDKEFLFDISPASLTPYSIPFNGFLYEEGDSVWVTTSFKVTENIGGDIQQLKTTNEFYTSNTENPSAGEKYQCGYYNDHFTMLGYYFKNAYRRYTTVSSCSNVVNQNFYLSVGDCCSNYAGGNIFPSEYRYWGHVKTATVKIPAYYEMSNVKLRIRRTKTTNRSVSKIVYDLTPSSVNGYVYTFDLEQYYEEFGGVFHYSDDGFYGTMYIELSPSCEVPINVYQEVEWMFNFEKGDYIGGGVTPMIECSTTDQIKFSPPQLSLSSSNPIIDGVEKTVAWNLKVKTTSSATDANNSWIHIKNPSGDLQIVSVTNDDTGEEMTMNGDLYRIGIIEGGSTKNFTIVGEYGACVTDYITVYAGYECTDYSATFDDFDCSFTTLGLFVEPKPAQMQVTLEGQNVGDECGSVVQIEIDVSSVKFASVDDITVEITPVGNSMTFESGSGQLQYPLSASYLSIANPTYNSGTYLYTIADYNSEIAEDGLPGVLQLSKNHFKLKFNMELEESFIPGDYVLVSIAGQSICGEVLPVINHAFDPSVGFQLASSSGLTSESIDSWSSSWADYNNDGYDDLFITNYDATKPNILYKNNGDKTFTKVTSGAIVTDLACSVASTWGDYDNDGNVDLFVANNVGSSNFLYHNNGNSTFTKITTGDIVESGIYCHNAAWADYDNDGFLDLFVAEYFPTKTNHLFHNNGDGTFTAVEGGPVVTDAGHSIGAAWGDYNNDGLLDLFVPNTNHEENWLYKNIGNGQFVKVNEDVMSTASNSVGCSWGDYNNDGYLDMFIANSSNSENFLYENNGDGTFSAVTEGSIVSDRGNSHGSTWIDIDNDGDLDLYVTNDQDEDNYLYRNESGASFTKIESDLTEIGGDSFGTAISDYDNDGDYDLFVANHGSTTNFFFENIKGQCSEYLCLNLIGNNSNYSAIGAKVRAKANIYGTDTWQMQEVSSQTGGGAGGQNTFKVIFGLGDAVLVDSLIIEWPSGYKEIHTDVLSTASNCNVYVEDNGALVSGIAYVDENFNCQYDQGEMLMKNVAISIAPDGKKTYTNSNGAYSFYMNIGTYEVTAETPNYYTQNCPTNNDGYTVVVSQIGVNYPDNDFGFKPAGSKPDLAVCLSTTMLRVNFTNDYAVTYQNTGTDAALADTIIMTFDDGIEVVSSTIPWDLKEGQNVYWYISSIPPQTVETFYVTDSVTSNVVLGEYGVNTVRINSRTEDADYSNNGCTDENMYVGAIDPNDKLVFPETSVLPGESIRYKIRFQNVGNFPADNVTILDTISPDLDINTLRNVLTSHDAVFTIEDNIFIWNFEHINLPDSVHNEPESHGYVQFNIDPVAGLPLGRVVENSATIIFDFYQYTPTNTTMVQVRPEYDFQFNDDRLVIFPQPAVDNIIVSYKSLLEEDVLITITDAIGQVVKTESRKVLVGWNDFDYALDSFDGGAFFLSIKSSEETNTKKMLIVR